MLNKITYLEVMIIKYYKTLPPISIHKNVNPQNRDNKIVGEFICSKEIIESLKGLNISLHHKSIYSLPKIVKDTFFNLTNYKITKINKISNNQYLYKFTATNIEEMEV